MTPDERKVEGVLDDLDRYVHRAQEWYKVESEFREDCGTGRYNYGVSAEDVYPFEAKCYEEARGMLRKSLLDLIRQVDL